jgi:hypothetical protein
MDLDDFYKFIGYAAVVLFIIYIFSKVMRVNARLIEGLTNRITTKSKTETNETS